MKVIKPILFVLCLIASNNLFAQNEKAIEADLLRSFKKIDYYAMKNSIDPSGGEEYTWPTYLEKANTIFAKKLKGYIQKYPTTITYPFNSLIKHHLHISTSTDGLFRIYSWDTETGGTAHHFENVLQYKSGENFKAIIDTPQEEHIGAHIGGNSRPSYGKIYTFKVTGHSYYLSVYSVSYSTWEGGIGICIFTMENGKLSDAKLIKTESGLDNDLFYECYWSSVADMDFDKRPAIRFDNVTNTIYLPLVDGNRKMTKKFIEYKFTGQYFEKVKN